ncbi:uncharacterized protein LOC133529838 [Cydia pomonella]|uniref:uncharacterized protein LOC133529838 n=1 Tax=Cydia pomonella TaxID=82600 RepID=UPI002ADDC850|nr:uncharacterized protein LOC133529838 [Cydia pomonella]
MGIFCEINLNKPADGKYKYTPGSIVSGAIRYYLDEEYTFQRITISLKGLGKLRIQDQSRRRRDKKYRFWNSEDYVDIDHVIYTNEKKEPLTIGQYEMDFNFQLPENVPPSLKFYKHTGKYKIWCFIKYYVRIKFERPGTLNLSTRYKKELNVISGATPRLSIEPLIHGDQKKLLKFTSICSSKGVISVKATIASSIVKPGENIKIDCEIDNNTSVIVKGIKIKLIEVDKYSIVGYNEVMSKSDVEGVNVNYGAIFAGEATTVSADLPIPNNCSSIEHSKMIARDYAVGIILLLPSPHINMYLEIPVQVIEKLTDDEKNNDLTEEDDFSIENSDDPPSYWEVMYEDNNIKPEIETEFDGVETLTIEY